MKKSSALKYIVYTFAFVVSFFMLFNSRVSASVSYEKDNIVLTLEEEGENYVVSGGHHTCVVGDDECFEKVKKLVVPGSYNGKKVVAIKDATSESMSGVLEGLKDVVTDVVIDEGVQTIGFRSFYGFSKLKNVELSSSVILIKNNAFEDSGITTLKINRYESATPYLTGIEGVDAFISTPYLSKVVFPSYGVCNEYKVEDNYEDLNETILAMFTYEVKYVYYVDGVEMPNSSQIYYPGDKVNAPIPEKDGFDFVAWLDNETENEIKSTVTTNKSVYLVNASWKLSVPIVTISSYLNDDFDNPVDPVITYGGKSKVLKLVVDVEHYLKDDAITKISYKWTKDGVVQNVVSNVYEISKTSDSGVYTCLVTLNYGLSYKEVEADVSIVAKVDRAKVKISVNGNIVTYGTYAKAGMVDGKYYNHTELVDGQTIKSADLPFYTNDGNDIEANDAGEKYYDVLKIENVVIGYEDDEEDCTNNYEIEYDFGDLTVTKKAIVIDPLIENIVIEYGEDESIKLNKSYTVEDIYGKDKEISVTYVREKSDVNIVGPYRVKGVVISDQKNLSATLDPDSVGKVIIIAKSVDVDWSIDDSLTYSEYNNKWVATYDKEEKVITAKYKDIYDEEHTLFVEILKNESSAKIVNAGEYIVTAYMDVYNSNYILMNNSLTIDIAKAESYFLEDKDFTQTKEYNGQKQYVDVTLNHNEAGDPSYYGEDCIHAQTRSQSPCAITVSYAATENYSEVSEVFYLKITPIVVEVEPDLFVLPYGSSVGMSELKKLYNGINGETFWVYFSKEGSSSTLDVGFHSIGSAYTLNTPDYVVDMIDGSGENKIQIVPGEVEIRFYHYEGLVYDGQIKNIDIMPVGFTKEEAENLLGLQIDYNGKEYIRDAGSYRIDLSLTNTNYAIKGNSYLEFEIAKANYNVKNLSFKSKEVRFDFKSHTLVLDGELPKGLSVQYTIDGEAGNGTYLPFKHKVKVTFIGDFDNYNYIEPMEATLHINATWFIILIVSVITLIAAGVVGFILLVKHGIIRFTDKEQRRRLRLAKRNNRAILAINEMFRENKKMLETSKEEEEIVIEEDITFVKNVVATKVDTSIELSFVDELYKSDKTTKEYYSEVKNELLSYEGIVSKIKRDYETFYVNNIPVAKFDIVDGSLVVYFALDPTLYKKEEYKHENVSKNKDFASVPLKLRVQTIESLRHAKMFVRIIRKREKLKFTSNFIRTDYVNVYTAKDNSSKSFKKKRVKKGSKEALED